MMTKQPKPKLQKSKPGPEEERLVISHPQGAIDALLNKKPAKK